MITVLIKIIVILNKLVPALPVPNFGRLEFSSIFLKCISLEKYKVNSTRKYGNISRKIFTEKQFHYRFSVFSSRTHRSQSLLPGNLFFKKSYILARDILKTFNYF